MLTGQKLVEAIAAERSRQTDKYDPLIALPLAARVRLAESRRKLAIIRYDLLVRLGRVRWHPQTHDDEEP